MEEKKDIFDKIMSLPFLEFLQPFYRKNKEVLLYVFFGGLTFLVSIGSYAFFALVFHVDELIANVFSWFAAVLFAYITNRIWVFFSQATTAAGIIKEMISFFGGRLFTLLLEELIIFIFITRLGLNSLLIKIIAQIVVICSNYFISKFLVFKRS